MSAEIVSMEMQRSAGPGGARVLLVDDEPAVLSSLRRLLGTRYQLTLASGGEQALQVIADSEPFAVVMSDMRMPAANGVAVLEAARRRSADTVRIILTGHADYDAVVQAVNRGAVDQIIAKPASRETLVGTLDAATALNWTRRSEAALRSRLPADVGDIASAMVAALEHDEFVLHYQPQVDLASGQVAGFEALIRWNSPDYGLVSPAVFIPVAELTGFIVPMTDWVLRTAARQMVAWRAAGMPAVKMAVNVSPRHLEGGALLASVRATLAETGLPAGQLELELTESMPIDDQAALVCDIEALNALGVDVGLDDFGAGFCTLSYVDRLDVSKLKLDKSLVDGLRGGKNGPVILEAMVGMARRLGLKLVAEGVETQGQLMMLRKYGCDVVQGFYFARPMPAGEVAAWLAAPQCDEVVALALAS